MNPLGIFDHHQDVGDPKLAGNAVYDPTDQTYTLSGAGANLWGTRDQFHFAGKKIKGRKRHIVTDTQGNLVGLIVHEASIQDRDGAPASLLRSVRAIPGCAISLPMVAMPEINCGRL